MIILIDFIENQYKKIYMINMSNKILSAVYLIQIEFKKMILKYKFVKIKNL